MSDQDDEIRGGSNERGERPDRGAAPHGDRAGGAARPRRADGDRGRSDERRGDSRSYGRSRDGFRGDDAGRGRDARNARDSRPDDRRSYGDRPSREGGRGSDGDRGGSPQGGRGSYGDRGGSREGGRGSYGDRGGSREGGRGSYGDRGERGESGRSSYGDRGRRDDRRSYGSERGEGERRAYGEARGPRGDGDRRPYAGDRGPRGAGAGGDRPRGGGRDGGPRGSQSRRDDRPRGGAGREDAADRRGGPRLTPKAPRRPEPAIREGVTGYEVDRGVKNQLRTLSKENAEGVAKHLVMVSELLDVDLEGALAHAETAARRAGRVPAAREALGLVAYRMGDWARALSEFRTVRRLSGSSHLLPLMVDCERGLGRPEKALELAQTEEAKGLGLDERIELAIVVSGVRRDLGQLDAAAAGLVDLVRRISPNRPAAARLYYAYADVQLELGHAESARDWFARAVEADHELTTDAAERLDELDGVEMLDLLGDEEDEDDENGAPASGTQDDERP